MIFVTVGTHEQAFNRLIEEIDKLKIAEKINEDVVIQTGFSTYTPIACSYKKFFDHDDMMELIKKSRITITHGGPSSFLAPLQFGKIPIVVPRRKEFHEHVNDHQLDFVNIVAERKKNIIVVQNIESLGETINNYDEKIQKLSHQLQSNNELFNEKFTNIISSLFK